MKRERPSLYIYIRYEGGTNPGEHGFGEDDDEALVGVVTHLIDQRLHSIHLDSRHDGRRRYVGSDVDLEVLEPNLIIVYNTSIKTTYQNFITRFSAKQSAIFASSNRVRRLTELTDRTD